MSTIYWHIPISLKFAYKQISHKATDRLRLEGNSGGLLVQPLCSGRVTTAEFTGLCPDGFWVFPRMRDLICTPRPMHHV